jgi:hypothetical protein
MKNAVLWDVTPYGSCKNRRFRETYCLQHQGDKNRRVFLRSVLRLLVTAIVVPSSCHSDDGGHPLFRNVRSYKRHTI